MGGPAGHFRTLVKVASPGREELLWFRSTGKTALRNALSPLMPGNRGRLSYSADGRKAGYVLYSIGAARPYPTATAEIVREIGPTGERNADIG